MRKFITHQNLDLIAQEPEKIWKAIFSNLTCFCCKNADSDKSTFNSRVCLIKLSEGTNNLSFAKTQLLTLTYNGQKILMSGIVLLNFFSFWSWKNFNSKVGKNSLMVFSNKKCFTNFYNFSCSKVPTIKKSFQMHICDVLHDLGLNA